MNPLSQIAGFVSNRPSADRDHPPTADGTAGCRGLALGNRALASVAAAILLACLAGSAAACDTPVYRYAMYRWTPAYYAIFYLHDAPTPDDVALTHQMFDRAAEDETQPLNIELIDVDMSAEKAADRLPPVVRDIWTERDQKRLPAYVVLTPQWQTFPLEKLDAATVEAMIDSPKRRELAGLLDKGQTMAFVLLSGEDAEANEKAEKTVQAVIESIASGEGGPPPPGAAPQSPYFAPPPDEAPGSEDEPADNAADEDVAAEDTADEDAATEGEPTDDAQPADVEADAAPKRHQVGLLKVRRDDPAEAWLVKCLLGVEEDLPTLKEPMVFGVYGRARALPPCVGPGINGENLMEYAWFVTGACSCTVKEQNPGVDLLIRCNWDAASKAMSDRFGAEEGNPYQYGGMDLFPELLIPADDAGEAARPDGGAATEDGAPSKPDAATPVSTPAADAVAEEVPSEPDATEPGDEEPGADAAARNTGNLSTVPGDAASDAATVSHASTSPITTIGVCIGVAVVLLGAATFLLVKKP